MPAAPTDFSFDRDIAPHANRFFNEIDASSTLSHGAKMRLQGSLLGGVAGIETQRLKLQEERDQGRMRKLQYEDSSMALEQARAERARREQSEARRAGVSGIAKGILDGDGDTETKRQALARTAMDYTDDKDAQNVFGMAERALPTKSKEEYTAMQVADLASKMAGKVDPELIPMLMQNPAALGGVLGTIAQGELERERDRKLAEDKTEQFYDPKKSDEFGPNDLDKNNKSRVHDEQGKPRWMDDESTATARRIIQSLDGTPEEIEEFEKLGKDSKSDRERHRLAENVRLRYQLARARGAATGASSGAKPRWNISKSSKE
jgi:hypothetical protein